ncbi:MAG: TetR family transcriptional regulator [Bacilli bacterium]|nr:TetR family transcriptional regulator [Bacilli bacterium]
MARPLNRERGKTRTLVLHSATKLFIENGYTNTRIKDIAADSGVGYNEIFRMFTDKDTLLSHLVDLVIEHQFEVSKNVLSNITNDELFLYVFESVLQLYITELNENIREMYAVSYSLPSTSHKIYDYFSSKIETIFKKYLPEYETKDFYELEIATAGIMRGFIINPCNMYFTIDRKVQRFIRTTLKIYEVPREKIEEVIAFIESFDMKAYAEGVLATLYEYISDRT